MRKRRFAILGLGQFGRALCRELSRLGAEVLAVDVSAKRIEQIKNEVAGAAIADIRDRAALEELFSSPFDVAVIAIGGALEAAIMATLHLKEMGVEQIWVEANTREREQVMLRVGATRVISPEREMGRRLAQRLANPNLMEFLPLTGGHAVVEVEAPSWALGKSLAELHLRSTMNLAVIRIRSADGKDAVVPGGDARVGGGDVMTLVGLDRDIARFREAN